MWEHAGCDKDPAPWGETGVKTEFMERFDLSPVTHAVPCHCHTREMPGTRTGHANWKRCCHFQFISKVLFPLRRVPCIVNHLIACTRFGWSALCLQWNNNRYPLFRNLMQNAQVEVMTAREQPDVKYLCRCGSLFLWSEHIPQRATLKAIPP